MFGCVLSQLKPSELYILGCEKDLGLRRDALGDIVEESINLIVPLSFHPPPGSGPDLFTTGFYNMTHNLPFTFLVIQNM